MLFGGTSDNAISAAVEIADGRQWPSNCHVFAKVSVRPGDILFLISCSERIGDAYRQKYRHVLVLHASDLPKGRGWSPMFGIL